MFVARDREHMLFDRRDLIFREFWGVFFGWFFFVRVFGRIARELRVPSVGKRPRARPVLGLIQSLFEFRGLRDGVEHLNIDRDRLLRRFRASLVGHLAEQLLLLWAALWARSRGTASAHQPEPN